MKIFPEEPTPDMVKAWCDNCHAWDLDAYKAMHKAAPEVEQEPLNEESIMKMWDSGFDDENELILVQFARAIEKAHGIGVE